MKDKLLEKILHALHTLYESLEFIIIALAKTAGITGKAIPMNVMRMRSVVFASLVVTASVAVGVDSVDMTSPQVNITHNNSTNHTNGSKLTSVPPGNIKCPECHGSGVIQVEPNSTRQIKVDCPDCIDGWSDSYHEFKCPTCDGNGWIWETVPTTPISITCPTCKGKGYIPAK